jgi:hypothetical protein
MRNAVFLAVFCVLLSFCNVFAGPVSVYGALKACTISGKGRLCGSNTGYTNTAVQLRGVSLGWSNTNWETAAFFNVPTVNAMVDDWKAEIIRVPLGYSEYGGYQTDAAGNWNRVKTAVDAAIAKDVYVIIDWHSHSAHNETAAAKTFFETTVAAYHNKPNVIFEIYNEPVDVNWSGIKTYADAIVSAIRAKGANNLILVGTPEYSARPNQASGNYLTDSNIGYVFHFYAATHQTNTGNYSGNPTYSAGITTVLDAGKPVFVTEYGTTDADGGDNSKGHYNTHNATYTNNWHTFMDNNLISNVAWNVNDKYEGSAFFGTNSGTTSSANRFPQSPTTNFKDKTKMTTSGQYIYDKLVAYAASAPWRNETPPPSSSNSGGGSGSSSSSGGSGGSGATTLIDNFEDGDGLANTLEPWYIYTDKADNGLSTVANAKDGNGDYIAVYQDGANWVAGIKNYSLVKGGNPHDPYIALGLDAKNNPTVYDLSKCTNGFSYRYKGSAHNFKAQQSDVTDYAYHYYEVSTANTNWATVNIPLANLQQPDWGVAKTRDMKKVNGFAWEVKGGLSTTTGSLLIDDFTCLGNMPLPPKPSSSSSGSGSGNSNSSSSNTSGGNSSSSAKNSSSSNASSGNSSSSVKNSSSSNASGGSSSSRAMSSSSRGLTPIAIISEISNVNGMQLIKNGVSLQVSNNAALEIFSLNGNLLRKSYFSNGVYSVQFSDLPKGLYIVNVKFGSHKEVLYVPVK